MKKGEKIFITEEISILGRKYPVKCTKEEAVELKKTEKALTRQLTQYRIKYAQIDDQDCLSMALIENEMKTLHSSWNERKVKCLESIELMESLLSPESD